MAICIDGNFVCLGGGCFCQTPTGIAFSGEAVAEQFCDLSPLTGSSFGYVSGGVVGPPFQCLNDYQKFSFTSDVNSTCVGGLTDYAYGNRGNFSKTNGYSSGGYVCNDLMNKFPFAADGPSTDIGELQCPGGGGASQGSLTTGFLTAQGPFNDVIQSFPFSADSPSSDVGELTNSVCGSAGNSSPDNGYNSSGDSSPGLTDDLQKFPFASVTSAVAGSDTNASRLLYSTSSDNHGYLGGGLAPGPIDDFRKFPFASDTNASTVGEITRCGRSSIGSASATNGYFAGGYSPGIPGGPFRKEILKFPFASDTPISEIGCLTQIVGTGLYDGAGQQV